LGLNFPTFLGGAIGTLLPLIGAALLWRFRNSSVGKGVILQLRIDNSNPALKDFVFLFMSIAFLSCYFAGLSFDYRLVFLALGCLALLSQCSKPERHTSVMWGLLLVALWGSSSFGVLLKPDESIVWRLIFGGFQFFGDLALMILVPILIVNVLVTLIGPKLKNNLFGNDRLDVLLNQCGFSRPRAN
jgi:hypothetical protein